MIALSISLHQKVIVVMAYFFDFQFVLQPLILGSCIFVLNIKNIKWENIKILVEHPVRWQLSKKYNHLNIHWIQWIKLELILESFLRLKIWPFRQTYDLCITLFAAFSVDLWMSCLMREIYHMLQSERLCSMFLLKIYWIWDWHRDLFIKLLKQNGFMKEQRLPQKGKIES